MDHRENADLDRHIPENWDDGSECPEDDRSVCFDCGEPATFRAVRQTENGSGRSKVDEYACDAHLPEALRSFDRLVFGVGSVTVWNVDEGADT